ncbi:MAG: PIN domain-containing protein [Sporichthyaceae bacterium]
MMLLADTSAWNRSAHPAVVDEWIVRLERDELATTGPVRLEVLYSARSAQDYVEICEDLDALHQVPFGQDAMERAQWVQRRLAEQHSLHHRSVQLPDLLIAAAAELAGAVVWHYDEDYDRIAAVTEQPMQWIAPRGSL